MFTLLGYLLDIVNVIAMVAFIATGFRLGPFRALGSGDKFDPKALGAAGTLLVLSVIFPLWVPGLVVAGYGGYKVVEQRQQRKALGGRPNPKGYLGR